MRRQGMGVLSCKKLRAKIGNWGEMSKKGKTGIFLLKTHKISSMS